MSNSQRRPDALLALQRTAGNAAVNRLMIQRQSLGGGGLGGGGAQTTSSTTTETLTGFATSSAELTPAHKAGLTRIAADLNAQSLVFGGFITIVGFSDRRGNAGENQALGQRRADAVRDHLQQLVTDEATKQQIRAYSLGAPREGPGGDVPSLRKVEITITRRSYNLGLPTPTPLLPGAPSPSIPDILRLPPPRIPGPDPGRPQLPDWFWRQLPPRPPEPSIISQVSRWLNETLRTRDLARVAASVAGAFGFNQAQVRRLLEDSFQAGGESAVKELLNAVIQGVAGPPSSPPSGPDESPYGPVEPIPFPTPQLQLPPIRF